MHLDQSREIGRQHSMIVILLPFLIMTVRVPMLSGQSIVDVVTLKSGLTLRGGIDWQEPNGTITMIVSHSWLQKSNPLKCTATLTMNLQQTRFAREQTRDRITERMKSIANPPRLDFFLKKELERINQQLETQDQATPIFLWVEVPYKDVAKITRATDDQRRLALFAWSEQLGNVETRDAVSLKKELLDKGIRVDVPAPDLSESLLPRPQTPIEWAARMALIEYTFVKPFDFQGIGETITRIGNDRAVSLGKILPKMLEQQLSSLFSDLTNENNALNKPPNAIEWLKPAIHEVQAAKQRGFRVTRVSMNAGLSVVNLESRFVAEISPERWQTIWQAAVVEDGTKIRPAEEAQIEQDPQFMSINETIQSLGIIDANMLKQSLRVGTATMTAQQAADRKFSEFQLRYTQRLDGPPLRFTP